MVTRNSAPTSTKVAQPTPAKAKDSPWMPARSSRKKKSSDLSLYVAASSDDMDLDDEVAFPKLASSPDPSSSPPPTSLAVAAAQPTLVVDSSPPPPPPSNRSNPPQDRQATPPRNNLSPASRSHRFYFNLQVLPSPPPLANNSTAQQRIDAYHSSLIAVLEALLKIDETVALWPFLEPTIHEAGLLTNPTALGHSIHQLTRFFDGLRIRNDFPPAYLVILMGFSMEYEVFMENARLMLTDVHAKLFKRPLQAPHVTSLGWLVGSHGDMSLPPLEQLLQDTISQIATSPIPSPKLALSFKPIWDGTKKSARTRDPLQSGCQGLWAIHVDVETSQALSLCSLLKHG